MGAPASVRDRTSPAADDSRRRQIFAGLVGLAALAVLLQGLWAGLFLQYSGPVHRTERHSWLTVHARGGEVACALALLATVWAILRLRSQLSLVLGATALTVLLVAVAYVGGLITDDKMDSLIPLHIPLALGALILAVWLSLQAAGYRRRPG